LFAFLILGDIIKLSVKIMVDLGDK